MCLYKVVGDRLAKYAFSGQILEFRPLSKLLGTFDFAYLAFLAIFSGNFENIPLFV